MGVSNVECSTVVILTACSNCTTLGSSRQIPAKIASPLGEAITTALHKATEDVDHPVKCGTISIPQMFNGTMRFFVANIAKDIFSAPLNMNPSFIDCKLSECSTISTIATDTPRTTSAMTRPQIYGLYVNLEGSYLTMSFFEGSPA